MLNTMHVGKQEMTSFGEGWQEFGVTNKLQGGYLLIFALVGFSHFLVYILRGHSESWKRIAISIPAPRAYTRKSANPKRITDRDGSVPKDIQHTYFEKRLFANAIANDLTRDFELPKPFLRVHGDEVGDKVEFVVSNKSRVWSIKVYRYSDKFILPDGPMIYLSDDWQGFLRDNWLQPGDLLGFFLSAHS